MAAQIDISALCDGLERDEISGIWRCRGSAVVSYPEHGHASNFAVEDVSFWFAHRNACILALIERFPPPAGPMLDVGGGNGFVTRALQRAGHPAVLLEPGEQGVINACARGVANVVHAELQQAAVKDRAFAAAGAFDVVEHVPDDASFLKELRRILVPNGHVYLTVPAHNALWSDADERAGHFRRYDEAGLRSAIERAGLECVFLSYFFRPLVPLSWLLRALPWRLGLRRGGKPTREAVHGVGAGAWLTRVLGRLLSPEVAHLANARNMAIGASLIAVARKPGDR